MAGDKVKLVPALRERGLRRGCGAEPPGCEPPFKGPFQPPERKADTMKTYLLKSAGAVEPKSRVENRPPNAAAWSQRALKIAQPFRTGTVAGPFQSPVRDERVTRFISSAVPAGFTRFGWPVDPALKRWAILDATNGLDSMAWRTHARHRLNKCSAGRLRNVRLPGEIKPERPLAERTKPEKRDGISLSPSFQSGNLLEWTGVPLVGNFARELDDFASHECHALPPSRFAGAFRLDCCAG